MQTELKKEITIDLLLFLGTVGATFILGIVTLPYVHVIPV
jgi:hypothetical protein